MSDQDDIIEAPQDAAEESGPDNFFIDILTGNKESASAKKLLVQKVLVCMISKWKTPPLLEDVHANFMCLPEVYVLKTILKTTNTWNYFGKRLMNFGCYLSNGLLVLTNGIISLTVGDYSIRQA